MKDRPTPDYRGVVVPFIVFTSIWGSTWIVIRGQISTVPPQWSVAYRFLIAAVTLLIIAAARGQGLRVPRRYWAGLAFLGFVQFAINFNGVYLAEQFITSGVVAIMFALLLVPSSLLAWLFLGQKPGGRFVIGSVIATAGIALLLSHELQAGNAGLMAVAAGTGFTLIGMLGAAAGNVYQARPSMRELPFLTMLAWAMAAGTAWNIAIAFIVAGPPVFDPSPQYWMGLTYLALAASVLAFMLYFPVVRTIGPGKAAYSSMIVPIIAMGFSTAFERYQWTSTAIAGSALVLVGMAVALSRNRSKITSPDAG